MLLDNRQFDLIGAPLIALAIAIWLTYDFVRTRRAVKRGEPLRVWYLRHPVYPGRPDYSYYAWQREYPAVILFVVLGLLLAIFAAAFAWAAFHGP